MMHRKNDCVDIGEDNVSGLCLVTKIDYTCSSKYFRLSRGVVSFRCLPKHLLPRFWSGVRPHYCNFAKRKRVVVTTSSTVVLLLSKNKK